MSTRRTRTPPRWPRPVCRSGSTTSPAAGRGHARRADRHPLGHRRHHRTRPSSRSPSRTRTPTGTAARPRRRPARLGGRGRRRPDDRGRAPRRRRARARPRAHRRGGRLRLPRGRSAPGPRRRRHRGAGPRAGGGRRQINLMVNPATVEGLSAIADVLGAGISVNVTLIFSLPRYRRTPQPPGSRPGRPGRTGTTSAASTPWPPSSSPVWTRRSTRGCARDRRGRRGADGRAAVTNARLAYRAFEQALDSGAGACFRAAGAPVQRPLWASTGVKDPALPDTLYVTELVAPRDHPAGRPSRRSPTG